MSIPNSSDSVPLVGGRVLGIPELLAARQTMIDRDLRGRGICDPRVLAAMERIPRELFVEPARRDEAYADRALPTACGQTISQPYMVAVMTELLAPQPHEVVLEVGTGSGYQTAVLAQLAGAVHSVERIAELSCAARERLAALGISNVQLHVGDGSEGLLELAPFDGILISAATPRITDVLRYQLRVGGRLVLPVGDEHDQTLTRVERTPAAMIEQPVLSCRFVKLIGTAGFAAD
ncbi:MAG: protein-L-isoaspartate(D-aspartate) O-methyltransferase [Phycisphaerae bacterium]